MYLLCYISDNFQRLHNCMPRSRSSRSMIGSKLKGLDVISPPESSYVTNSELHTAINVQKVICSK